MPTRSFGEWCALDVGPVSRFLLFNYYYLPMNASEFQFFFFSAILTENVSQIVGERLAIWLTMMSPSRDAGETCRTVDSRAIYFRMDFYLNRFCTKE